VIDLPELAASIRRSIPVGIWPLATVKFRGPTSDISRVYTEVHAWIQANGYVPAGAPMELYTKKPKVVGGRTELTAKIEIPVRRR